MPILDTYIDIKIKGLNGKYKEYYRNLGYVYPEIRTNSSTIRVSVKHLTKGSGVRINVLCPICNETRQTSYDNYNKSSDICRSCSARIRGLLNVGSGNGQWGKKGKETPRYIDGRTIVNETIRKSVQYKEWRLKVYRRDRFKCQCCGKVGRELQCHHIESFSKIVRDNVIDKNNWREFHEVLFNLDNGVTLCRSCHKKLHDVNGGYRTVIGAEELDRFLNEYEG